MVAEAKTTLAKEGVLEAALAYYRTAMNPALRDPALSDLDAKIATARIAVPTLYLHGEIDGCIAPEISESMGQVFSGAFERIVLDGVGHFVHAEAPDAVAEHIQRFVGAL